MRSLIFRLINVKDIRKVANLRDDVELKYMINSLSTFILIHLSSSGTYYSLLKIPL